MLVNAACALGLVEHGTHDVARQPLLALGESERGDARVDLGADVGRERVEPLA